MNDLILDLRRELQEKEFKSGDRIYYYDTYGYEYPGVVLKKGPKRYRIRIHYWTETNHELWADPENLEPVE